MDQIVMIAGGVAVAIGLGIFFARQSKANKQLGEQLRAELRKHDKVSLPDLVKAVGMKDGFMARGKVMNVMNLLVASGDVLQEEPPGTTVSNRLDVLTFRMVKRDH